MESDVAGITTAKYRLSLQKHTSQIAAALPVVECSVTVRQKKKPRGGKQRHQNS
jgi:hypothetical protein